jgi:hypothetical protein
MINVANSSVWKYTLIGVKPLIYQSELRAYIQK